MTAENTSAPAGSELAPIPRMRLSKGGAVALLVVVLTIAAGFIPLGESSRPKLKAKILQSKATIKGLEIAIKGYKTEYGKLPATGQGAAIFDSEPFETTAPAGLVLFNILSGNDVAANFKKIRFWEAPPRHFHPDTGLLDSWDKHGYKIALDHDNDGKIRNPAKGKDGDADELNSDVIIYSAGPDGDFATWNDNVCSWLPWP
jgi:hypothetical protein